MQHCLQDMLHRATACGQDISALECMTIDAVSLEVSVFVFAEHIHIMDDMAAKQMLCAVSAGDMRALPSAVSRESSTHQCFGELPATVWLSTSS